MSERRDQLTAAQLQSSDILPLVDMSFFVRPDWAEDSGHEVAFELSFAETQMTFPLGRDHHPGEDVFPRFAITFEAKEGALVPSSRSRISTDGSSGWDVFVGTGAVWSEPGDLGWSRASFPLDLTDRIVGSVRNCAATFVFDEVRISNTYVQCSQETADLNDQALGNIRAIVPTAFAPVERAWFSQKPVPAIPTRPLSEIDVDGEIAEYFGQSLVTNASTSMGAIYLDGVLYVDPPATRHGDYPYPAAMRHGVYSVSKSLIGALSMFYFAERYGPDIFDERITDFVPQLADRPEWSGVTFVHALNMATGTRGGEGLDLLFTPVMMAEDKRQAIANIAEFGDASPVPGAEFNYATSNYLVLSMALQGYVEAKEGAGVRYWDLLGAEVLEPIGADTLDLIFTRGPNTEDRIPVMGYGARPTLDEAAKIARLIANEGAFEGEQLLNRQRIREALARTSWQGFAIDGGEAQYRHSFWSRRIETQGCEVTAPYMQGHGSNTIIILPSGAIIIRFMDEFDEDIETIVEAVERVRPSCGSASR